MSKIIAFRASDGLVAEIEGKSIASGGTKTDVILEMLEGLGSIDVATGRNKLPEISGVYIVYVGKRLLYVGQTSNLRNRIRSHHRLPQFVELNARMAWFEEGDRDRITLERELIDLLDPELNNSSVLYKPGSSKRVGFRIPDGMAERFRIRAELEGRTFSDIMSDLLAAYLETPVNSEIAANNDAIDPIHQELAELRAAIEQVKCETVEMLNVLRIDIWGDDKDCEFDDERNLVVGGTVTDTSQDLILVQCDVRDLKEEFNCLPAELARQDKRIDMWVEQVKMRDAQTLKHKAEVEAIVEVYGKLLKGIEHNCDRIEVLEKVNKISHKTGSGMGFGK